MKSEKTIDKQYSYNRVSTYFLLNKKSFLIATITGIIYNVLSVLVPYFQGKLIDLYQQKEEIIYIVYFAISFFFFILFIQINRYLKRYYVRDFSNRMVLKMRMVYFDNLLDNDIENFFSTSKGDFMNRNLQDIKDSCEGVRKILTEVYDSLILMVGYFIMMMIMDYLITLLVFPFLFVTILVAILTRVKMYKYTLEYKKEYSSFKDLTLNNLKNEIYYRGMGVSKNYYDRFLTEQDILQKKAVKSMMLKNTLEPLYKVIAYLGIFVVIYLGSKNYIDSIWQIGLFSSYLTTYILVSNKVSKIGKTFNAISNFKVSWKRCKPYLNNSKNRKQIIYNANKLDLEVSHLTFGYNRDFILKDISFKLNRGETLVICGMVHEGKSTLAGALSGIYTYSGSIKLQGIELKEVRDDISLDFISYIPSEVQLFTDTVKYNIAFKQDADIDNVIRTSLLNEDIKKFEKREDTILLHSKSNISGGQQKRLMVARALYPSSKLIIMDDPFSAIDIKMSIEILNNIKSEYLKNSILILVSNQKEILKRSDHILFLKDKKYLFDSYDNLQNNVDFIRLIGDSL